MLCRGCLLAHRYLFSRGCCSLAQITADGMIVDETTIRQKVAQKDNKEYNDAMLARAVVARSVEMEVTKQAISPRFYLHVCDYRGSEEPK